MSMRCFTRLTKAFTKPFENLTAAVSLRFMHDNFVRTHRSLSGQTPAMAAGFAHHPWTLEELIGLLEVAEATPIKRGRYTKTREREARGLVSGSS